MGSNSQGDKPEVALGTDEMMGPMEKMIHLKKVALFSELQTKELAAIASIAVKRVYPRGEIIIREGEPGESLFLITSGKVCVTKGLGTPQELFLAELGPGECFGEMSLFDREPRSASIFALEETQVLELDKFQFEEIMKQFPKIAIQACKVLCGRLRELQERLRRGGEEVQVGPNFQSP